MTEDFILSEIFIWFSLILIQNLHLTQTQVLLFKTKKKNVPMNFPHFSFIPLNFIFIFTSSRFL